VGTRLSGDDATDVQLEIARVESSMVTHIRYRVVR